MKHCGTQTLESKRLILRRFAVTDASAMYRNWASDPEVTKYLSWAVHSHEGISAQVLEEWVKLYEASDNYHWAITLKAGQDEPIGSIGVVRANEDIGLLHIGYCLGQSWWSQGIMSEALRTVINHLFEETGANRIEARFDPRNTASGQVMKKCHMIYEGTLRQADSNNQGICDASYYSILRSERC